MSKLDWSRISQALYGNNPKSFVLDNSETKLLLHLIADRAIYQGAWRNDGNELDSAEWDTVQGFLDKLVNTLVGGGVMRELQFIVYLSGVQTVSNYDELFELDTAEYNLNGQFDLVNHKWIVPETGVYMVGAFVQFWDMSGSDNWIRVRTKLNGIFHLNSGNLKWADDEYPHALLDDLPAYLTAGDEVQFFVTQSDIGSNRDTADYNKTCRAWAWRVG